MENGTVLPKEKIKDVKLSRRFKFILTIGIILTGFCFLTFLVILFMGIREKWWNSPLAYLVTRRLLFLFSMSMAFLGFCNIAVTKRPFSKMLFNIGKITGFSWIIISFVFPHMNGFIGQFVILSNGFTALSDGEVLTTGILLTILSYILSYGYEYQQNQDETI